MGVCWEFIPGMGCYWEVTPGMGCYLGGDTFDEPIASSPNRLQNVGRNGISKKMVTEIEKLLQRVLSLKTVADIRGSISRNIEAPSCYGPTRREVEKRGPSSPNPTHASQT